MPQVSIPSNLTTSPALAFVGPLRDAAAGGVLEVDVSGLRFARPFGALLLAAELRALADDGCAIQFVGFEKAGSVHYILGQQGFFRYLGHEFGRAPGEADGGDGYLPVTEITRGALEARMAETGKALGPTIHAEATRLAHLVTQSHAGKVVRPVAYCFREVIRNVFEHAQTDCCVVFAQRYKKGGNVEIAIVDKGRGIRASLAERHAFDTDEGALRAALEPGRSRAILPDADALPDGPEAAWANSGFGLFVLSELGRRTGAFSLVSGSSRLELKPENEEVKGTAFAGTALCLKISKPKGVNFEHYIENIIAEGEERSHEAGRGRASRSTRTLA